LQDEDAGLGKVREALMQAVKKLQDDGIEGEVMFQGTFAVAIAMGIALLGHDELAAFLKDIVADMEESTPPKQPITH
jgi:hypothetical protein